MAKFDNKKCYDNLMYLYKANGLKIGEFEGKIGASVGHFSRLVKEDGKLGTISSEILFNAAELFSMSVELLGSVDIREMDSTEKYIFEFINKLIINTRDKNVEWQTKRFSDLNSDNHLNCIVRKEYDEFSNGYYSVYDSGFWDSREYDVSLSGDTLYFYQKTGYFILTRVEVTVSGGGTYFGYELYFKKFSTKAKSNLCFSSSEQKESLNNALDVLYKTAMEYIRLPKVNDNVKSAIDDFMNGNGLFSDDDCPF